MSLPVQPFMLPGAPGKMIKAAEPFPPGEEASTSPFAKGSVKLGGHGELLYRPEPGHPRDGAGPEKFGQC